MAPFSGYKPVHETFPRKIVEVHWPTGAGLAMAGQWYRNELQYNAVRVSTTGEVQTRCAPIGRYYPFQDAYLGLQAIEYSSPQHVAAVALDNKQNVLVASSSYGANTSTLGNVPNPGLIKYSPSGNILWRAQEPPVNGIVGVVDVGTDAERNVYWVWGSSDMGSNYKLTKYTPNGGMVWDIDISQAVLGVNQPTSMMVTPLGAVVMGFLGQDGVSGAICYEPDGLLRWTTLISGGHTNNFFTGSAKSDESEFALIIEDKLFCKIDVETGDILWTRASEGSLNGIDLAKDGSVFTYELFGESDWHLIRYDTDGERDTSASLGLDSGEMGVMAVSFAISRTLVAPGDVVAVFWYYAVESGEPNEFNYFTDLRVFRQDDLSPAFTLPYGNYRISDAAQLSDANEEIDWNLYGLMMAIGRTP